MGILYYSEAGIVTARTRSDAVFAASYSSTVEFPETDAEVLVYETLTLGCTSMYVSSSLMAMN